MKSDETGLEQEDKAAFNMALAYLQRLDIILKTCNEAAIKEDFKHWHNSVLALYRELSPQLNVELEEQFLSLMKSAHKVDVSLKNKERVHQYNPIVLTRAETFLRRAMHSKGLLMPSADDPGMAVLG